jgi:hypothetical protein
VIAPRRILRLLMPSVSPPEDWVTTWPLRPTMIPAQASPESENDSSRERLHFCLHPTREGTFDQDRVGWDEMWGTAAQLPAYGFKGPRCVHGRDARPPPEAGHL